jgi:hypothetical protein
MVPRPDVKQTCEPANQCSRARISRPLTNRTTTSAAIGDGEPSVHPITAETTDIARQLRARILAFIASPSDADFDTLVLDVHAYQYRANPAYGRYVDRLSLVPPRTWREVPAVPAEAFRLSVLACAPAERVYRSSGTTAGPDRRAQHHVPDVEVYRAAALAGFRRAVLPVDVRRRFLVAAPERATHPASSLGEMVTWLRDAHDLDTLPSFLRDGAVDVESLAGMLDRLDAEAPIVLLAVTSAVLRLTDWADTHRREWRLPPGSLIIDTGGCKGYERHLGRAEIVDRYRRVLGIEPDQIVNEYGMTELGSQLYARGDGPHVPPPWLRSLVCDPATGREVASGEIGCLRHVDLANMGSVVALQTEDLGRRVEGGIELLGRAPGAVTRGCSLLASASAP